MKEIAQLTLPGSGNNVINNPVGFRQDFQTLGDVLSAGFELAIYLAGFLMLMWMFWGVFEYIFAGGAKEKLAKARARITYAIIGFIIVIMAFAIGQYVKDFSRPTTIEPTRVVAP